MTPRELRTEVGAGKFAAVYYFFGTEDYRIVEAEKYVASQFLPDRQLTTNYRKIDARKTKCPDLLAEMSTYPMLGERQVLAVSDIQSYQPRELDRVFSMLEPTDPNRLIVLRTPSARLPKKTSAFFKKVSRQATVVEFNKLDPNDSERIIRARLVKGSLDIDDQALGMLVELVAGDLGALEAECAKLITYKEAGEVITEDDIREVASGHEVFSVFDLADQIANGRNRRALAQVRKLLAEGSTADAILYFVEQHFLFLYLTKNRKPLPPARRWLARKLRNQANRFTNERLESNLQICAETTASLRRGGLKPEAALEALVVGLLEQAK
ncbi:MAG: DNA polymerase III subunit delta [Candidatus Zixiibacteriota bacterium]|nr:MAG: DNA polymerase III subunit delta [candidate division Zixibacteria bacterium]